MKGLVKVFSNGLDILKKIGNNNITEYVGEFMGNILRLPVEEVD